MCCLGTLNQKQAFAQRFTTVDAAEMEIVLRQKDSANDNAANTEVLMFVVKNLTQAHVTSGKLDITMITLPENANHSRTEGVKETGINS